MRLRCAVVASAWLAAALVARAESAASSPTTYALCGRPACVLVDRDGHPVMARVFERIEPMVGDLAIFGKGDFAGVVARDGHTVLEPHYKLVLITATGRIWASESRDDTQGLGTLFDSAGQPVQRDAPAPARPIDEAQPTTRRHPVEILKTPLGVRLGDGHGKAVSETYARVYEPFEDDEQSMLAVQGAAGHERFFQLFRDGRALAFPEGGELEQFREGVATWRVQGVGADGKPRTRQGLVDDHGAVVMPATFDEVGYARAGLLRFRVGALWGVADLRGRIRVPASYANIDFLSQAGLFGARTVEGVYGVIDADGRWIVPARFKELHWLDDTLVAGTEATVDADGRPDSRTLLFERSGQPWRGPVLRYAPTRVGIGLLIAYDADGKQMLLDRQGGVVVRDVTGGSDFELPDTAGGPFFAKRDGTFALEEPYGAAVSAKRFSTIHQQFRQGRALADDALLGEHGRVIATYASAAPPGASWPDDFDAEFEAAVDPCFNPDPTETTALPEPMTMLCTEPALHASLRETILLGAEDGGAIIAAIDGANRFQAQLLACSDRDCLALTLERRFAALCATVAVVAQPVRTLRTPVPQALRRRLVALAGAAVDLGEGAAWSYIDLRGDGRRQVMAWAVEGMHDNSVAIWAETAGRWRLLLSEQASGIQTTPAHRASVAWPDLIVSQHGGPAEAALIIYGHAGRGYVPLETCTLRWAATATEAMFRHCDGEKPWPVRAPRPPR